MRRPILILAIVVLAALAWVFRYSTEHTATGNLIRINRYTGHSDVMTPEGWRCLGVEQRPVHEGW